MHDGGLRFDCGPAPSLASPGRRSLRRQFNNESQASRPIAAARQIDPSPHEVAGPARTIIDRGPILPPDIRSQPSCTSAVLRSAATRARQWVLDGSISRNVRSNASAASP